MAKNSIVDIGKLSKPIEKLLDHIANTTGVIYEPTRIVRKAKADAKALLIQKEADLLASSIEKRALSRIQHAEVQRQLNIESIVKKTIPLLDEKEFDFTNNASSDWLNDFFKFAQEISDDEVQLLWAKVLAEKLNKNSNYTFRSLEILRQLDNGLALSFQKFSAGTIKNQENIFFIVNYNCPDDELCESLLETLDLKYAQIEDLISMGLVVSTPFHRLLSNLDLKYSIEERMIHLRFAKWHLTHVLGLFEAYRLTREGDELSSLIEKHSNVEYIKNVDNLLQGCGLFFVPLKAKKGTDLFFKESMRSDSIDIGN